MAALVLHAAEPDIYDLSLDRNLMVPDVPSKAVARIQDYQYKVAMGFVKQQYQVETMRDGLVFVITIPAASLFAPCDTVLSRSGEALLKPVLELLKPEGFCKLMLAMHADDTGSPRYADLLTRARVNAVYDWIDDHASVDYVVPYAEGADDPLEPNDSMDNRKRNRRLEIYVVPEKAMIAKAKKGKIKK